MGSLFLLQRAALFCGGFIKRWSELAIDHDAHELRWGHLPYFTAKRDATKPLFSEIGDALPDEEANDVTLLTSFEVDNLTGEEGACAYFSMSDVYESDRLANMQPDFILLPRGVACYTISSKQAEFALCSCVR